MPETKQVGDGDTKMKYYFITYEETIGEFSRIGRTVQEAADSVSVDDVINDYFGDFYGDTTTRIMAGTFIRWGRMTQNAPSGW